MNSMARELGMHNTTFADPTGLDAKNVSTARDIMQLVLAAQVYPEVNLASNTAMVVITQARHRAEFGNTNPMVRAGEDIVVSKTGYISSSGGCLAMMINTAHGTRIVVVLGSRNTHTRVPEARQLLAKV
jgi:D-alanyl-D-alanine endopeptidase (penicillin-binding protein 7)